MTDAAHWTPPLDTLPLFAVPDIRTPPPSQPGSPTSEAAADALLTSPARKRNTRRILAVLLTHTEPICMAQIAREADVPINVVCARLSELRPMWVDEHRAACRSLAKASLRVNGYTVNAAGRARVQATP